jgi:Glycosyl transferase family 90
MSNKSSPKTLASKNEAIFQANDSNHRIHYPASLEAVVEELPPHLIAIPTGSSPESSDNDSAITSTKQRNYSIMNQVRHRRSNIMKSLSRWDTGTNETTATANNQYSNAQPPHQNQTGTSSTRSFSQTLVISIASMCLISLCTTMLWMFQVPHYNQHSSSTNNFVHNLMPTYDTTRSRSSINVRPPPLLSVGGGAKFFVDTAIDTTAENRRLESDTTTAAYAIDAQVDNQYSTDSKLITFHRIAQHGSTDHRKYTAGQRKGVDIAGASIGFDSTAVLPKSNSETSSSQRDHQNSIKEQSTKKIDLNIDMGRATRFPSVDERVRVYMSNWYLPPCPSHIKQNNKNNIEAFVEYNYKINEKDGTEYMIFREVRTSREKIRGPLRTFLVDDTTDFDVLRHLNMNNMLRCTKSSYCTDFVKYLFPAVQRLDLNATDTEAENGATSNVLMYQFSDAEKTRAFNIGTGKIAGYPNVPNLKKFRYALSKNERERVLSAENDKNCVIAPRPVPMTVLQQQMIDEGDTKVIPTSQPIIMKLKIQRHYGYVQKIPTQDVEWSLKKNQAIFRGQFTGRFPVGMDSSVIKALPPVEQCNLLHRCRLVYNAALKMKLVDAKLALPVLDVRKDFPQEINNVALYGDRVSIEDMLTYKAIIMLEGNDVSSGLKWALYSNSVVMTQTPTKTSWAMEELLEPWVHYVPLSDDLSDVEEKMQWIIDHDEEAQQIAFRGKLWIHDLVFHPDASTDEPLIFDDILRRTMAHYVRNPNLEVPSIEINIE